MIKKGSLPFSQLFWKHGEWYRVWKSSKMQLVETDSGTSKASVKT